MNDTIPKWMTTNLLTIDKVPKYIREITSRLRFEPSRVFEKANLFKESA